MIHVLDLRVYRPYFTSIALLSAVIDIHQDDFEWKQPPYEYEYKKKPIDMIMGDPSLRHDLKAGAPLSLITEKWQADLASFVSWRRPYLIY